MPELPKRRPPGDVSSYYNLGLGARVLRSRVAALYPAESLRLTDESFVVRPAFFVRTVVVTHAGRLLPSSLYLEEILGLLEEDSATVF